MKKLAIAVAAIALIGTPAFAADMAIKAPPPAPAPAPTWTGFYGGIQFGGGWSDEAVNNNSGNDILSAALIAGIDGNAPLLGAPRSLQSGLVGGLEAGYNWQWSSWLLGIETDFSGSSMSGRDISNAVFAALVTQSETVEQKTDWFGTVRGRAGWLATPNLLLFGTGGFAYGRVSESANWGLNAAPGGGVGFGAGVPPFGLSCGVGGKSPNAVICFAGNSSGVRTGWIAGGGLEWLLDQHWSAKIEYLFVDLGTDTVRLVNTPPPPSGFPPGTVPASFNAIFHDRFNVVRLGLNYKFW
jgi:outer membrane immunogenic protein